ncbi:MAG: PAS domain S-box protein [Bdellovibrionaceae bacterium]|nr:PAS domain S-box protein [Pseudobdellovibrionaceae bacterium]
MELETRRMNSVDAPISPIRILVVDDRPENFLVMEAVFSGTDYELVQALSGPEALEKVRGGDFAVILMDAQMPKMDGFETARRIRNDIKNHKIPIIFITAIDREQHYVHRAYEVGAIDFIFKPLDAYVLQSKVALLVELYRKDRQLKQSELRGRHDFLENALDASVAINEKQQVVFWNQQAEKIFGYTKAEALGQIMANLIVPLPMREAHRQGMAHFLKTGQGPILGRRIEVTALRKNGSEFPIELTISALASEDGWLFYSFIRDITNRRKKENLIRESERRFRLMADMAPVMIWVTGRDQHCTWCNQCWLDFTGRTLEQEKGTGWADGVHPEDLERCLEIYGKAFEERRDFTLEYRLRRHDGQYRWLLARGTPLYDENDEFSGYVGSCVDLHDQKEAQETLRRTHDELEHLVQERTIALTSANHELESFSYSVSHDLRTPLRAIAGFSQALEEDYGKVLDQEALHYLRRIRSGTERMANLIDDLLGLSRISRTPMSRQELDLSAMVKEVTEELRAEQPGRAVTFVIQPDVRAFADAGLCLVILENLLHNAWKYTSKHAEARIEFGFFEQDGEKIYFVRDDGAGFAMEYANRLFGAFQRLHTEEEFSGSGIGLATVRRVVHRHGGRIWAEAALEQGATFYWTLEPKEKLDAAAE